LEEMVCFEITKLSNFRVATSWKSPGFFCCPGKSLNFVYKSWKVFENIWEISIASLGQNSKATFFKHRKLGM